MTYRVSGYSLSLFYYYLLNFPFGNEYDSVWFFASSPFVFKIHTHTYRSICGNFPFFRIHKLFHYLRRSLTILDIFESLIFELWNMEKKRRRENKKTASQKMCPKMGKLEMINLTFQKCFPPRYFIKIGK